MSLRAPRASQMGHWLTALALSTACAVASAQAPAAAAPPRDLSGEAAPSASPEAPPANAVELLDPNVAIVPPPTQVGTATERVDTGGAPKTQADPADILSTPARNLKAPAPSGAATPKDPSGIRVRAYGILWAGVFGTQPVQSFGLPTAVAPTAAVNPAIYAHADDALLTFQVQQTRAGIAIGEGTPFKGTLEIDFTHFDQSSPVAQAYPRIRIGLLEWMYRPNQKFFFGQTWDIFGNASGPSLLSHSYNLVGTLFQAGNIGFFRQQLGWAGRFGDLELSLATGMQGVNTGPVYNQLEQAYTPTGAARVMYHLPENYGVIGVSGIATSLRFTRGDEVKRRTAAGGHLFAEVTFGPLNLHGELYVAQNLANTGSLNLGQGRFERDLADAGGYLSGKLGLGRHALTAMCGFATVLRPSNLVPGYTPKVPASMGGTATPAVVNAALGPGIRNNMTAHVGYGYAPLKGLTLFLEPYVYATKFKLAAADVGRVSSKNTSWGAQLGSMYTF